ncbi:tetratricopeptide repeat protein [Streptomyces sp. CA-210063]|uniref:tetratricopeptide repeat protein n=1 Tax=Streptomyces sp. CA-210063 TaxID=2801029 RepID=UPI00214ADEAB|nr:tetratricopeptide repeat protein [Streptomyces sp. CA-210063]UUU30367.1 tetratricopeptide repeat protein [Streptomyces sp. CA-210063]
MTAGYEDHIDLRGSDFHGSVSGKVEHHYHAVAAEVPMATAALPAAPVTLIGRDEELVRILPALDPRSGTERPVVVCAVSGLAGIGKTALALHAAHRAHGYGWFPGGTLFADVAGYSASPLSADQVVEDLLDALGVRGWGLPRTTTARLALYRTLLAQQSERMLLVLDNASTTAQITPLIPASPRHRVLVTSRHKLTDLNARLIDIRTLAPQPAAELIATTLEISDEGDDRPAREPDALLELAALCGYLPHALNIAAGLLRRRRHRTIATLVDDIKASADPTDTLRLRPVFDATYRHLPTDQARLLRLLALAPTADVPTETAAAIADLPAARALPLLEDLAAAHLVNPTRDARRWRLHSLVRQYAAGASVTYADQPDEAGNARARVLKAYAEKAEAACRHLQVTPPDAGNRAGQEFESRAAALAWLDTEATNLLAAVQWTDEDQHASLGIKLALELGIYLEIRRRFDDLISVSRLAQQAAHRAGDQIGEAKAWNNLGNGLWKKKAAGGTSEAIRALVRARDLYRAIGDQQGEGKAWNNLGNAQLQLGRTAEAINSHALARHLFHVVGDIQCQAAAAANLGSALRDAGRSNEADSAFEKALRAFRSIGDQRGEAAALTSLGNALLQAGRRDAAHGAYIQALGIWESLEDWHGVGDTLRNLALVHRAYHNFATARATWARAAKAYHRAGASDQSARAAGAAVGHREG